MPKSATANENTVTDIASAEVSMLAEVGTSLEECRKKPRQTLRSELNWVGLLVSLALFSAAPLAARAEEVEPPFSESVTRGEESDFEPFFSIGTAVFFQQFRSDLQANFGLTGGRENPTTTPLVTFGAGLATPSIARIPGAPRLVIDGWYGLPLDNGSAIQIASSVDVFGQDQFLIERIAAVDFKFVSGVSLGPDFHLFRLEGLHVRPALDYRLIQISYQGRTSRAEQGLDGEALPGGTIFEVNERVAQHYLGPSVRFDGRLLDKRLISLTLFFKASALFSLDTEEVRETRSDGTNSATFLFKSRDRAFEFASGITARW